MQAKADFDDKMDSQLAHLGQNPRRSTGKSMRTPHRRQRQSPHSLVTLLRHIVWKYCPGLWDWEAAGDLTCSARGGLERASTRIKNQFGVPNF